MTENEYHQKMSFCIEKYSHYFINKNLMELEVKSYLIDFSSEISEAAIKFTMANVQNALEKKQ